MLLRLALLALLVPLPLLAPPAFGHAGQGCAMTGFRLEAECYATPTTCDPDPDNEHVEARPVVGASGMAAAFLPSSGCGLDFAPQTFLADSTLAGFGVRCGAAFLNVEASLRLVIDGFFVGRTSFVCPTAGAFVHVPWPEGARVPAGVRDVRVVTHVLVGPAYANLELDYLDFLPSPP